jgi:hypothetical protein
LRQSIILIRTEESRKNCLHDFVIFCDASGLTRPVLSMPAGQNEGRTSDNSELAPLISTRPPRDNLGSAEQSGGELGIRTPDRACALYSLSRRAPSASRSALRTSCQSIILHNVGPSQLCFFSYCRKTSVKAISSQQPIINNYVIEVRSNLAP